MRRPSFSPFKARALRNREVRRAYVAAKVRDARWAQEQRIGGQIEPDRSVHPRSRPGPTPDD